MVYIHWFRRDLRLQDNPALLEALHHSAGQVIPLFILDDAILAAPDTGAARVAFLLDSLHALDKSLRERGSRLLFRRGKPHELVPALAEACGAVGVSWNRDYTPFAHRRDALVEQLVRERGLNVLTHSDAVIFEPEQVLTAKGTPYTVFTPYRRTWRARVEEEYARLLSETALPDFAPVPHALADLPIPQATDLGFFSEQERPAGGEAAAQELLKQFVAAQNRHGINEYSNYRNQPALPGTSRLSAYLRLGCLAPRACLRAALSSLKAETANRQSIEAWIGELAWRDFYYQIMAHFPHVLKRSFRPVYDAIEWENDPLLYEAWCAGRTGYPIVDAAMRQLQREAWMHNRARMIVASFLTKDLLIDWRWGARYFMRQLVDGDHASNNGGWQWAAGTGTDAQPYFRVFNPVSQGEKFDPHGAYVRRYVPELEAVPDRYIHSPWRMPEERQRDIGFQIGRDYPAPIVDHSERREQALELYRRARNATP